MAKFLVLFFVIMCISQRMQITSGESEEEFSVNNIIQLVNELGSEIKDIIHDLSNRIPKIIQKVASNIEDVVGENSIAEIFDKVKEEISDLLSVESSVSSECSEMATGELEDLYEKTKTDVEGCTTLAKTKTSKIKEDVQKLMETTNSLTVDMKNRIEKCGDQFPEDPVGLSDCLGEEIEDIRNLLKKLKQAVGETIDITEKIAEETAEDIGNCLLEAKNDAFKNTEHVTEELKSCLTEI